jgi:hypothetical protein
MKYSRKLGFGTTQKQKNETRKTGMEIICRLLCKRFRHGILQKHFNGVFELPLPLPGLPRNEKRPRPHKKWKHRI